MKRFVSFLAVIAALSSMVSCSKNTEPEGGTFLIAVAASPAEGGTVTGGGEYPSGMEVTLSAKANTGYEFVEWNDGVTTSTRTIIVTKDKAYVATFQATVATYTITVQANPAEAGTVTGGGTYASGTEVTLTATAASGYRFIQWNDGVTTSPRTVTVSKDESYVASFETSTSTYTITATATPTVGGTVTGGGEYTAGAQVTLTATAASGYEFVKWSDGVKTASRAVTASADSQYSAYFKTQEPYIQFYYWGKYYNDNSQNYSLYVVDGVVDDDDYIIDGLMLVFDLNAPLTSSATKCDAGTYNYQMWTSDDSVGTYTFLDGYYDDTYGEIPSYLEYIDSNGDVELKLIDVGGSFALSSTGSRYTLAGTVSHTDYTTSASGSYTFSFTAEADFFDQTSSSVQTRIPFASNGMRRMKTGSRPMIRRR